MAIADEINDSCPHCGGMLRETYSPDIGFCPKCARQVKI